MLPVVCRTSPSETLMGSMVVAVDIGNSRTDAGVVDVERLTCVRKQSLPSTDARGHLASVLSSLCADTPSAKDAPVCISTVIKPLRADIEPRLRELFGNRLSWVVYDEALPVTLIYDQPHTLGADRLANLIYCHHCFSGATTVIVDSGTTITVDYLEQGDHFAGGAIMPGLKAQLESLKTATAELPLLPFHALKNAFPGMSTVDCIKSGIMYGCAGAVSRLVQEYRKQAGRDVPVIATGGAWPLIENLMDFAFTYVPDMTLLGIALYVVHMAERRGARLEGQ
jgi:type III pantothenate kinase